ncbi:MAG: GAF domain-containing protein, partial [Candidatus Eremiobacteraeota bacterium]|nr:GAF domain-containing protein [Candidatus Eremiobacteraeota bacterium]
MSEAQGERDRRLIQTTAALLSENYPFDQLAVRLCDALAREFSAPIAYVAVAASPRDPLIVAAVAGTQPDGRPVGFALDEGLPGTAAYRAGSPIVLRSRAEFDAYSSDAGLVTAASGMFVPIAYGDQTMGVIAVVSDREGAFDERDVRLLQAVARYFGIAVRNQLAVAAVAPEKPRATTVYVASTIVVIALLLSVVIWTNVALRAQQMVDNARTSAVSHLNDTAAGVANHINDSAQLATTAAAIFDELPHDRPLVEKTLESLLKSAQSSSVFGVGVWYAPGRFAAGVTLYGPYAARQGASPISITYQWMTPAYDYPSHPWYRLGIGGDGSL